MRVPSRAWAWATAAATAAVIAGAPSAALAAEPGPDTLPINVIAIQTNDADDQAEALTKALRVAVRALPGWSLAGGDYSLEVLTLSLKCSEPPDANCQSRIADQIKTDRYVWGTLKKKGANVVGDIHLWVRGKGTSNWHLDYSSNLTEANDDALKRLAGETITQLTGGAPKGGIHVHVGNAPGQVFIDGQPSGALKNGEGTFMAPSGPHKVTIKAIGFSDMETQVVVKPTGAPVEVDLAMLANGESAPTGKRRIAGFAAIGGGVLFAIGGIVAASQVASAQTTINGVRDNPNNAKAASFDWCSSTSTASGPGAALASACSKGKTAQTLEIVFFPLAAVAGGAGIYLVATGGRSAPKTGLTVNPQVGPGTGKIDLSYTW